MSAGGNTRRHHPVVRIAAVAACFAVLLVGMYPFLRAMTQHGGSDEDCYVSDIEVIYRQGAIYEVVGTNYTDALTRMNLPGTITEDMVGEKVDIAPDYGDVYSYAPLGGRNGTAPAALYLLHRTDEGHEGEWWYLTFSGFVAGDESGHVEAETMLQVYGIQSADDIAAVCDRRSGEQLLPPEAFYDALLASSAWGREDFAERVGQHAECLCGSRGHPPGDGLWPADQHDLLSGDRFCQVVRQLLPGGETAVKGFCITEGGPCRAGRALPYSCFFLSRKPL